MVILRLLTTNNKIEDTELINQLNAFIDSLLIGDQLDLLCALHLILLKQSLNGPPKLRKKPLYSDDILKILKTLYENKEIAANLERLRVSEECKEESVFIEKLLDLSERFSLRYKVLNISF